MASTDYAKILLGGSDGMDTNHTVDPDHVLHAIKTVESGGDYSAREAGGSGPGLGAYQFTGTWPDWSREYTKSKGMMPIVLPMTEANQDAVARFKVTQMIDDGLSARQIAAKWNSGGMDYFGKRGVNQWGQSYNVANHVEKFQKAYDNLSSAFAPDAAEASAAPAEKSTTNYADILLNGKPATIQTPTESQQKSQTIPGEPTAASHQLASFLTRGRAAFADKPETMIDVFAAERFPNLRPEARREKYFIKDGTLYYLDTNPGSNVLEAFPETGEGLSEWAKNVLAGAVGKGAPVVASTVGLAVGGIPGMLAGAAGGEAIRQGVARYALGEPKTAMGVGAEIGKEVVASGAGLAAGKLMQPGLNAIGRAGSGRLGRLASQDYRMLNPTEMQRLIDLGKKYGIPLTVPEATGSPTLTNAWNLASTSPYEASEKIMLWAEKQRVPQIKEAIARELDAIFPEQSIAAASQRGVQATADGLDVLKESRRGMSQPLYEAAEESGAKVNVAPVIEEIENMMKTAAPGGKAEGSLKYVKNLFTRQVEVPSDVPRTGEMKGIVADVYANIDQVRKAGISVDSIRADYGPEGVRAINRALPGVVRKGGQPLDQVAADHNFESADALYGALVDYNPRYRMMALAQKGKPEMQTVLVDDIGTLHNAKLEIDSFLGGEEAKALPRDIRRRLYAVKDSLVQSLADASPEYDAARQAYARGSKLVNDFMYGTENINPNRPPKKSFLATISELQGDDVLKAPNILFGPSSSPSRVIQARRFIKGQDEEAWDALARAYLQDRLETAVKNSQGWGYGYKFKETVFGTPRQEEILKEALGDKFQQWSDFMSLLDVTNRVLYRNSRTTPLAITKEVVEREAGGARGRVLEILGTKINLTKWAEINRKLATPEYMNRITDAMMDPSTVRQLTRIRQLSNPQKKAIEMMSVFGSMTGENAIDAQLSKREWHPERAPRAMQ